jgi:hypothetical protein
MMRGSAADGQVPTCVVDVEFEYLDQDVQDWAARVVQRAWHAWRERMGMLLLQHGLADLGDQTIKYASFTF